MRSRFRLVHEALQSGEPSKAYNEFFHFQPPFERAFYALIHESRPPLTQLLDIAFDHDVDDIPLLQWRFERFWKLSKSGYIEKWVYPESVPTSQMTSTLEPLLATSSVPRLSSLQRFRQLLRDDVEIPLSTSRITSAVEPFRGTSSTSQTLPDNPETPAPTSQITSALEPPLATSSVPGPSSRQLSHPIVYPPSWRDFDLPQLLVDARLEKCLEMYEKDANALRLDGYRHRRKLNDWRRSKNEALSWRYIISSALAATYVAARLIVIAIAFSSLRRMPENVYLATGARYVPGVQ
jgi:hypothetical protein